MELLLVLIYKSNILYHTFVDNQEVNIGSGKKDDVFIEELKKSDIKISYQSEHISLKCKSLNISDSSIRLNTPFIIDENEGTAICVYKQTGFSNDSLKLPYNCTVRVGRKSSNNVVVASKIISGEHFVLTSENGIIHVEDLDSTNGLYLNGKRISKAIIRSGDVLSVMNLRFHLINSTIKFENMGDCLTVNGVDTASALTNEIRSVSIKTPIYSRSPRTREQLPSEEIVLAQPPSKPQKFSKSGGLFASFASSGAMAVSTLAMGVASPALLAARAAGLISPASSIVMQSKNSKRRQQDIAAYAKEREAKYGIYIEGQKARIKAVADAQREILSRENPTPKDCIDTLLGLKRTLWERRPADNDFLDVRMGNGYEKLCVNVKDFNSANNFNMESDELRDLSEYIIEETRIVDDVPARLKLKIQNTVGVIGNRGKVIQLIKNIMVSLTVTHCYEDVRIVGLFDESEQSEWDSLKWLPHIWDENKQFRYLAFGSKQITALADLLHDTLKTRLESGRNSYGHVSVPSPFYVFIVGSSDCIKHHALFNELTSASHEFGFSSLFLFDELYALPHNCQYIIDIDDKPNPSAYDCSNIADKIMFTPDELIAAEEFDYFARKLSAVELSDNTAKATLPDSLTFLQGFGVSTVNQLDIKQRWDNSNAKFLPAPIGVAANGKPFVFDIVRHGPHGLVAGTTGSGKSEMLQSWILSVAVNYHPHDVNFVIIDFKGGGMANLLEGLPHVVGKITNIGSNINRSMESLHSELSRRQKLFESADVNKIDAYQAAYKSGRVKEPLPRLIIVADEFAELKKQEPEFMNALISAARIGRSLGVHLVLATQKPGGVVDDQINSNSSFRICLKVQNTSDSREMLSRPDAAKITDPGRAYVRVGDDDIYELIQTYWSGAPYLGQNSGDDIGNQVRVVDIFGHRYKTVEEEKTRFKSDVDELKAISNYMQHLCAELGIPKLAGPWLPELPERLLLSDLEMDGAFNGSVWESRTAEWLTIPIGRFDAPQLQAQGTQSINLASEGHYGIYGAPGTGKTTLLKTIIVSACTHYTPDELNVFILDFGGWNMAPMKNLPHVADVVLDYEDEKFSKFLTLISSEIGNRKKKFSANMVSSLTAYRRSVATDIPAIIIAIDNLVSLFEQHPDAEDLLVQIGREGASYGIYLVFTANSTNGIRYKLMQNIRAAVAFELTDKCDYAAIVGKIGSGSLGNTAGRAFFKGNPPVIFQSALYADGDDDISRSKLLSSTVEKMCTAWHGSLPRSIPVMPDSISFDDVLQYYTNCSRIPLGIYFDNMEPAYLNLSADYGAVIAGGVGSGKSNILQKIFSMINTRFSESEIYVFDSTRRSLANTEAVAYGYATSDDNSRVSYLLSGIVDKLNQRMNELKSLKSADEGSFDELQYSESLNKIVILIDDICDYVDNVEPSNSKTMERIVRMAKGLGVIVVAAGRTAGLQKYSEVEPVTRGIFHYQKGVAISDAANIHTYFKNNLKYDEKAAEFGSGNAMLFDNTASRKFKLMQ